MRKMIEQKRSPFAVDHGTLTSFISKKHKGSLAISNKERKEKEKLGEKVVALQQLVSPYGKTDTASVLSEATEYIQFLHAQVKVLSAAYLQATPAVQVFEKQGTLPCPYFLRCRSRQCKWRRLVGSH